MKPELPSQTAENNAALRAMESMRPDHERIFTDPLAGLFLSDRLAEVLRSASFREQVLSRWEQVAPGVCGAVLVRTRFFDDCLAEAVGEGLQQLVILGAGYDTRAMRIAGIAERVAVFEMDHPATQQVKLQKIRRHKGSLPQHVTYIPICFDKEPLGEKLLDRSYDPGARTLFIWEGVTYYIPPAAVDRTLAFIAYRSGPGSGVVFDYFPPSVADGTCRLAEAVGLRGGLRRFGEEILFGIAPDRAAEFLGSRGFCCVNNDTAANIADTWETARLRDLPVSEIFHFAHAKVKQGKGTAV